MKADYVCQDCGSRVVNEVALAPSRKKDCPYCGGRLWHYPGVMYFDPQTVEAFGALAKAVGAKSITICGTDHQIEGDDMQEFQTRVVEEKLELDERAAKLKAFTEAETFQSLPNAEQVRMSRQLSLMVQYSEVLGERIAAFV